MENQTNQIKFLAIAMVLTYLIGSYQSCNNSSKIKALSKKIEQSQSQDSSKNEKLKLFYQIEGYKISKRMLYDNNKIVRTQERPDDMMNYYDSEIKKLEEAMNNTH